MSSCGGGVLGGRGALRAVRAGGAGRRLEHGGCLFWHVVHYGCDRDTFGAVVSNKQNILVETALGARQTRELSKSAV